MIAEFSGCSHGIRPGEVRKIAVLKIKIEVADPFRSVGVDVERLRIRKWSCRVRALVCSREVHESTHFA